MARAFTVDVREQVFDRTDGKCHICHRRVAWKNYGEPGARGALEVDHSVPRAAEEPIASRICCPLTFGAIVRNRHQPRGACAGSTARLGHRFQRIENVVPVSGMGR